MSGPQIHLDAVGGVAGDMFVAAMCAAMPDLVARVLADISAVLPPEAGMPVLAEGSSGGLAASRLVLRDDGHVPEDHSGHDHHHHGHGHRHDDGDAGHHHDHHHHDHHHHAGGDAGSFADMRARIGAAKLSANTAEHAIAILTALAEVEAAIHGLPVDSVHFHEIADWDSLMDIVAAGSIIAALPGASWSVSDLPLGGGLVKTAHGLLPVPAPATAKLLEGFGWRDDSISGERVTPTGAAILRHLAPARRNAGGKLRASGCGAGTRDLPGLPNILRALVFETVADAEGEQVAVLSFEVDDMTGEEIAAAAESLRAVEGVFDLSIDSRLGKKARMMSGFRLLVRPNALDAAIERCLLESATIGLRWHIEHRRTLPRTQHAVDSGGRRVRLKTVTRPDGTQTAKAESDDLEADSLAARRQLQRDVER